MRMSEDPLALPQPRPRLTLWITLVVIALTIIGSLVYHYVKWKKWEAEWVRGQSDSAADNASRSES